MTQDLNRQQEVRENLKGAESRRDQTLDAVEKRARMIGGSVHVHGEIPAWCWRQAIAERFLGERIRDPEWAERMVADRG